MKGKSAMAWGAVVVLVMTGGTHHGAANTEGCVAPSVVITPSGRPEEYRLYGDPMLGDFGFEGAPLEMVLAQCASTSPARLVLQEDLRGRRYDIRISGACADLEENLLPLLRREVPRQTGFTYWLERRTTEVLVLTAPGGRGKGLGEPENGEQIRLKAGRVQANRSTVGRLAHSLERILGIPVVDETGLIGEFSFQLEWHPREPEVVAGAIREQLGLELKREKREIDVVVAGKRAAAR